MRQFATPIIPGFNPDPSIVLVNGRYYLATSSFEYLPGIALYTSSDLADWEPIGHVITRPGQANLATTPTPGGAWAPTIRHHDGLFHVIVTMMFGPRRCVLFTAENAAGPWSDGVDIPAVDGIDPDIAWDEDGTALVTFARMGTGIMQVAVDTTTGAALEEPRSMWSGVELHAPEGPHLYRVDGQWYLLIAEGGTERGHSISVARGDSPRGPFVGDPLNPVLSARSTAYPVQNLGHADIVSRPDGSTAMVMLGVRPVGFTRCFSPLGRESFLASVSWQDGWLRPELPELSGDEPRHSFQAHLTGPEALADPGWLAVRRLPADVAPPPGPGWPLVLAGEGKTLGELVPTFVGRRQLNLNANVSVTVDAAQGVGGLAARHSEQHWFAIEAAGDRAGTAITARAALAGVDRQWQGRLAGNTVELRIESRDPIAHAKQGAAPVVGGDRIALIASDGDEEIQLAELDGRYWSFETTESFTGRIIGMYAVEGSVSFSNFSYDGMG